MVFEAQDFSQEEINILIPSIEASYNDTEFITRLVFCKKKSIESQIKALERKLKNLKKLDGK